MNLLLTRYLATFQARVNVLIACSDIFTDLADMKEFRKLKGEVEEFIGVQHQTDGVPANPSEWVSQEIEQIESALKRADDLYRNSLAVGQSLLVGATFPIDIGAFNAAVVEVDNRTALWVEKLTHATSLFQDNQWNDGGDIKSELLAFAQLAHPNSSIHNLDRAGLHNLVFKRGVLWDEVETHIAKVQAAINSLRQGYEDAKPKWKLAADFARKGDYLQAEEILASLNDRILNGEYAATCDKIDEWKKAVESYKTTELESQLSNLMSKTLPLNPFTLLRERDTRLAIINSLDEWVEKVLSKIHDLSESDFRQTSENVLLARKQQFILTRAEVAAQMRKRVIQISALFTSAALAVSLISYSLLRYNTVVIVNPNAEGATVEIDGKQIGSTPLELRWAKTGKHNIRISHPYFEDLSQDVQIELTKSLTVSSEMRRAQGELTVSTDIQGVRFRLDSDLQKSDDYSTPATLRVTAGIHRVVFTINRREAVRSVDVKKNTQSRLDVNTKKIIWPGFGTRLVNISMGKSEVYANIGRPNRHEHSNWWDDFGGHDPYTEEEQDNQVGGSTVEVTIHWSSDGQIYLLTFYKRFGGVFADGSLAEEVVSSRIIVGRDRAFRRKTGSESGSFESCGSLGLRI